MSKVSGSFGLPELKLISVTKDRTGRTKITSPLFQSLFRKASPKAKNFPDAPKVDPQAMLKAARLKDPTPKTVAGQVGEVAGKGLSTGTTVKTDAPMKTGTTTSPQTPQQPNTKDTIAPVSRPPNRPPPLTPETTKLVDELPAKLLELKRDIEINAESVAVAMSGKQGKTLGKDLASLFEVRQSLLQRLETELAALEKGGRYRLDSDPIQGLRGQLIEMIIDVQFPELANARFQYEAKTDDEKVRLTHEESQDIEDLRKAHEDLTILVMDLRAGLVDKPDQAKVVTGSFLKAIADSPVLLASTYPPHDKMVMAEQLARALAKGDLSVGGHMLANTDEASVKSLLSGFRSDRYAADAGHLFVARLDPQVIRSIEQQASPKSYKDLAAGDLRKLIPSDKLDGFDKAVAKGRTAAKLRDEFEAQRTRALRDLGPKSGHLAETSVLLKMNGARVLDGTALNDRADDRQISDALKKLAKTNREGAFQIARLADAMQKLADAENEAIGCNKFGMQPGTKLDTKAIFEITGFTRKDVETLGYDADAVIDNFKDNMSRLGKAGFSNTGHVEHVMTRMRSGKAVLENRDVQDGLKADLQQQTAALGKLAQKEIMNDVLGTFDPKELNGKDVGVALTQAFTGVGTGVDKALFKTKDGRPSEVGGQLDKLKDELSVQQRVLQDTADELTKVEGQVQTYRLLLEEHAKANGSKIDLDKPAGLDSSKLILKALEFDDAAKNLTGSWRDAAIRERDATLQELKGYDASVLNRADRRSRDAEVPTIDDIRELRGQAEAIVFLRETGPDRLSDLRTLQNELTLVRDGLREERREKAPNLFAAADRLIRAAILANIDFDTKPTDVDTAFNPTYSVAGKRDKVEALVKEWGLDPEHFRSEIDEAMSKPIDGKTLRTWLDETRGGQMSGLLFTEVDNKPKTSKIDKVGDFAMSGLMLIANKRRIDDQMRGELDALVSRLPPNSKFDLMAGSEISLNTGRIQVEPSGTVTVRGRLSGSIFKSFVIETGSKGEIKLTGMLGGTVKVGVDVMAGYDPLKNEITEALKKSGNEKLKVDLKLAAELSLDAGYEGAGGFQVTFPEGEAGRKAAMEAIMKLTERQRPSAEIFENATDVADFRRHKGNAGFKAEVSAKIGVGWQPGGDDGDMFGGTDVKNSKSGASNKHGFGASAGVNASGGIGGKKEIFRSLDKAVVKTEFQTQIGVSAKVGLYAQTFTALGIGTGQVLDRTGGQDKADEQFHKTEIDKKTGDQKTTGTWDGGNATMPLELAGISYESTVTSIHKKKFEFDKVGTDGREVMTKAELKEITDGSNTRTAKDIVATFTDEMLDKLAKDPAKCKAVASILDEISRHGLSSSQIEVTYNIKPDKLAHANDLFRRADLAKANGDKSLARELTRQAQRIIDDRTNYTPAKISLIDKTSIKGTANRGMAPLVKLDIVSNVGTERVMLSVDL